MTKTEKCVHLIFLSSLSLFCLLSFFSIVYSAIASYSAFIICVTALWITRKTINVSYTREIFFKKRDIDIEIMAFYWLATIAGFVPVFVDGKKIDGFFDLVSYSLFLECAVMSVRELIALGGRRRLRADV